MWLLACRPSGAVRLAAASLLLDSAIVLPSKMKSSTRSGSSGFVANDDDQGTTRSHSENVNFARTVASPTPTPSENPNEEAGEAHEDEIVDDWHLPMDFGLFAQRERRRVCYYLRTENDGSDNDNDDFNGQDNSSFQVECVERLTPIDAVCLSNGTQDTTGQCAWMAAYFLLACLEVAAAAAAAAAADSAGPPLRPPPPSLANENENVGPAKSQRRREDSLKSLSLLKECLLVDCADREAAERVERGGRRRIIAEPGESNNKRTKRIIELGCGTGVGGLACLMVATKTARRNAKKKGGALGRECRSRNTSSNGFEQQQQQRLHVTFTDADPSALELCRTNCEINGAALLPAREEGDKNIDDDCCWCCDTAELPWTANPSEANDRLDALFGGGCDGVGCDDGQDDVSCSPERKKQIGKTSRRGFDSVLATDVVYDIGALPALFNTASSCLRNSAVEVERSMAEQEQRSGDSGCREEGMSRHFVLSHVPRACYGEEHPPVSDLESYIVDEARKYGGFRLAGTLRPGDLLEAIAAATGDHVADPSAARANWNLARPQTMPDDALNSDAALEEMDRIGAAVFIFAVGDN